MFLDVVVIGSILQAGTTPVQGWQYALAVGVTIPLLFLEVKGFQRFWPPEPLEE